MNFPNQQIIVVHRSDGSGTTYIFTDYLSKISKEWEGTVGKGTSVKWPVGLGGKGNEGVAGQIRQLQGSIGYVELIYAVQNKIAYGSVQNAAGNFVKASLESVTEAAGIVAKNACRIFAFRSRMRRAKRHIPFPALPGCWSRCRLRMQTRARSSLIF